MVVPSRKKSRCSLDFSTSPNRFAKRSLATLASCVISGHAPRSQSRHSSASPTSVRAAKQPLDSFRAPPLWRYPRARARALGRRGGAGGRGGCVRPAGAALVAIYSKTVSAKCKRTDCTGTPEPIQEEFRALLSSRRAVGALGALGFRPFLALSLEDRGCRCRSCAPTLKAVILGSGASPSLTQVAADAGERDPVLRSTRTPPRALNPHSC